MQGSEDGYVTIKYSTGWNLGNTYKGWLKDGKREDYGVFNWTNGNIYKGEWENDKRHGDGEMKWALSGNSYKGQWLNDTFHGYGQYTMANGNQYQGEFFNSHKHGYGVFTWKNGNKYEGYWSMDKKHGQAIYSLQTVYAPQSGLFRDIWEHDIRKKSDKIKYEDEDLVIYSFRQQHNADGY